MGAEPRQGPVRGDERPAASIREEGPEMPREETARAVRNAAVREDTQRGATRPGSPPRGAGTASGGTPVGAAGRKR